MKRDDYQFSGFLEEQKRSVYGLAWSKDIDEHWVNQALYIQSLTITDALLEAFTRSISLSSQVEAPKALYFLRYGAGRRLQMMWHAFRNLTHTASVEREAPLSSSESSALTEDINVIYLNIRGTLDNLCLALLHECAPEKIEKLRPSAIGLFLKGCIKDDERFADLCETITERDNWDRELKTRRDPAAHRIPLAVPPQLVTESEAKTYTELQQQHADAAASLDFDAADSIMNQIDSLGRFLPCFVHDPDQPPMPIYPTVPDDLGQLLSLFQAVEKFLVMRRNAPE